MSSSERLFRNSVFGGFNKDDVIDYIENMKNEFFEYRSQVEQTVKELNKKIAELESEAKAAKQKAAEADKRAADAVESSEAAVAAAQKAAEEKLALQKAAIEEKERAADPVGEISLATDRLRRVADEICDNLSSFIDRISESSIAVTIAQPAEEPAAPAAKTDVPERNVTADSKKASFADTESILSFIDGILASNENRKKEEEKEEKGQSLLDDLLPNGLFK